ncbi:hypothetical protein sos41_14790 [Alphaproteobacteria bacterium SO-S41]|nr:hypothetical protein sos41_14790 [Alphaproteobacteria bacterium SO-S41]
MTTMTHGWSDLPATEQMIYTAYFWCKGVEPNVEEIAACRGLTLAQLRTRLISEERQPAAAGAPNIKRAPPPDHMPPGQIWRVGEELSACAIEGWASPELWGMWSDGKECSFLFSLVPTPEPRQWLRLNIAEVFPKGQMQSLAIEVNGRNAGASKVEPGSQVDIVIEPDDLRYNGRLFIRIFVENATRPSDIGVSLDGRQLGIAVSSVEYFARENEEDSAAS